MRLEDLDYPLPKELIAQKPLPTRDASRLMVVYRESGTIEHRVFRELADLISSGDVLVLNDTRVSPARVLGKKAGTGGKVDVLFLSPAAPSLTGEVPAPNTWRCLIQPTIKEGQEIHFPGGFSAVYTARDASGVPLLYFGEGQDVDHLMRESGTMPLPPYIKREADSTDTSAYQTVYSEKEGAVAAPTAGLHFTPELLRRVEEKGVKIARVTLHVGYGTFKPVEDLENHRMHAERFELTEGAAETVNAAKRGGQKVWAVGTTSLRVLETCVQKRRLLPGRGETDLYIKPPFEFEAVDHLLTNFHLPKTTLLLLVSAFMGEKLRKKAYDEAVKEKYRFYSYGDAMLII